MRIILIIPCGKKKRKGTYKAKELYIGSYFRAHLLFAETFFRESFLIFSAKYGLIYPETVIKTYDVTFTKGKSDWIKDEKIKEQIEKYILRKFELIISLGGKNYAGRLSSIFSKFFNIKISTPLVGMGLGKQISLLTKSVKLGRIIFPLYC